MNLILRLYGWSISLDSGITDSDNTINVRQWILKLGLKWILIFDFKNDKLYEKIVKILYQLQLL